MKSVFTLLILVSSSAWSLPLATRNFSFQPLEETGRDCIRLGYTGQFQLKVDSEYPNIADVVFLKTKKGFAVFRAGPDRWRMSIQGSWSESITIDFAAGTLRYSSSRKGRSGVCVGSVL